MATRAVGRGEIHFDAVAARFAREMSTLPAASPSTNANLSYDGLVNAGLRRETVPLADLGSGLHPCQVDIGGTQLTDAHELRIDDDLPPARVHLLHLHGSIGWLRTDQGELLRCSIDDLRAVNYWREYGAGRISHTPVVVLTDRKTEAVNLDPFALAYRIFGDRLVASDHWLIVGYGSGTYP